LQRPSDRHGSSRGQLVEKIAEHIGAKCADTPRVRSLGAVLLQLMGELVDDPEGNLRSIGGEMGLEDSYAILARSTTHISLAESMFMALLRRLRIDGDHGPVHDPAQLTGGPGGRLRKNGSLHPPPKFGREVLSPFSDRQRAGSIYRSGFKRAKSGGQFDGEVDCLADSPAGRDW
jgi:hypothetical protein